MTFYDLLPSKIYPTYNPYYYTHSLNISHLLHLYILYIISILNPPATTHINNAAPCRTETNTFFLHLPSIHYIARVYDGSTVQSSSPCFETLYADRWIPPITEEPSPPVLRNFLVTFLLLISVHMTRVSIPVPPPWVYVPPVWGNFRSCVTSTAPPCMPIVPPVPVLTSRHLA